MGRPKNFKRDEVLKKAIPVFWKQGLADTSVQDLEKATGVNKSGLYAEFKDKDDLFLASLRYYAEHSGIEKTLGVEPLGWANIENFLKARQTCSDLKGCFLVNTVREFSGLPAAARAVINDHIGVVKKLLVANLRAASPRLAPEAIADLILTFNAGLCLEQNAGPTKAAAVRKIEDFLSALRGSG